MKVLDALKELRYYLPEFPDVSPETRTMLERADTAHDDWLEGFGLLTTEQARIAATAYAVGFDAGNHAYVEDEENDR